MNFFAELKRRNVFKVAVSYAVVAWIVLQVVDIVLPTFDAPRWVNQTLLFLIILGFPVALILAWVFELTPEGVKLTQDVPAGQSLRQTNGAKFNGLISAGLALALVLVAVDAYVLGEQGASDSAATATTDNAAITPAADTGAALATPALAAIPEKSIAVLPFANLSDDPDQEYFSDGLTEELINKLSQVDDLLVTGRNSSFYFKGRDDEERDIGQQLGVAHLLQGSVRKSGERMRISAQLLDVASNANLWSETFDRNVSDIFAVQDEIAAAVTTALSVTLGAGAFSQPGATNNVAAYDEFMQALQAQRVPFSPVTSAEAISHYERAVQLDPAFAAGWARLAGAYQSGMANLPPDQTEGFGARVEAAMARARALTPELPELLLLNAWLLGVMDQQYAEAERLVRQLLENAGNTTVPLFSSTNGVSSAEAAAAVLYSQLLWVTGRTAEALQYAQMSQRLDPKIVPFFLTSLLLNQNRIDEALEVLERADNAGLLGLRVLAAMQSGDKAGAVAVLQANAAERREDLAIAELWLNQGDAAALEEVRRVVAAGNQSPNRLVVLREWAAVLGDPALGLELLNTLTALSAGFTPGDIWLPLYSDVRKLPGFKDYVREQGLLDYWRSTGNWSDYCRPVNDDFECF